MTGYAQRVQWSPHRLDMSRAMFGVSLTPLPDLVATTLERLPRDIGARLKHEFWKRHGDNPDWEKKHEAQDWLAAEVAAFEREKLHIAFDDAELRLRAERTADLCRRMVQLEYMQDQARSLGIEPPEVTEDRTRENCVARLTCQRWWRKQFRKLYPRRAESHMRAIGMVHRRGQLYASDLACEWRRSRKLKDRTMLQEMQVVSDAGDQLELWDVVQASTANPALRRGELMLRARGFEEVAEKEGHRARFFTATCPSAFHRVHRATGKPNERWQRWNPREGQRWLCEKWALVRSRLQKMSIQCYGFRVAEPHHDGTPHWHLLLFGTRRALREVARVMRLVWSSDYADELDTAKARKARFHVKAITRARKTDGTRQTATGYIAKYIAKNIDGFAVGEDLEAEGGDAIETSQRVAAWASLYGIRQFQQLGGPTVTLYRELRRIRREVTECEEIERARLEAERPSWSGYIRAVGGIQVGRNTTVRLWKETTGELSCYGEMRGDVPAGVMLGASASKDGKAKLVRARKRVRRALRRGKCEGDAGADQKDSGELSELHQCPGVMNPPQSAAMGCEARNLTTGHVIGMGHVDRAAKARPADAVPPPSLTRVRTREKIWRIQRKAKAGACSPVKSGVNDRESVQVRSLSSSSSLGPVSITVRGSKTMPGESSTGARGSGSIRGSPWTH